LTIPPVPIGPLHLAEEVADALADGRPIVALESTIIAHGFPRPRNLQLAHDLEQLLRSLEVTPATIAVLDGRACIGLDGAQLARIAEDEEVAKASVRDLPVILTQGRPAATTVASTAVLAYRAGIRVFATGGLGGVHREATRTFDESADLTTLSRTPILIVAAGVKSILDVPATLERMETLGITVVGYRTDRFPGFYVTDSGEPIDWRVDEPAAAAEIQRAARALGLEGAVLVANPIDPAMQLDPEMHERVLTESLAAADARGVRGKDVTPFLLDHIQRVTGGASLEANVAAVTGNVALAGAIANALAAPSGTEA
jgi:pseudouridylate synthase